MLPAVTACLTRLLSTAGAEPLLEGRVLLATGQPAAGARVRLFASAGLEHSLPATTDESGNFALPLTAPGRAAPLPACMQPGQNYPNPFNPSTIIPYQSMETARSVCPTPGSSRPTTPTRPTLRSGRDRSPDGRCVQSETPYSAKESKRPPRIGRRGARAASPRPCMRTVSYGP